MKNKRINFLHHSTAYHLWGTALQNLIWLKGPPNVSPIWLNKDLKVIMESLREQSFLDVYEAVQKESLRRYHKFLDGIYKYYTAPSYEPQSSVPIIAQQGECSLLDYGPKYEMHTEQAVAIFVPSLINHSYIFSIPEKNNLLKYLAQQGIRPLVTNWGNLGHDEINYDFSDYIQKVLNPFIEKILQDYPNRPLFLVGYCMGGVIALGSLQKYSEIKGAILMATPWDFSATTYPNRNLIKFLATVVRKELKKSPKLSGFFLNAIFHAMNPLAAIKKFQRFPDLSTNENKKFIELEDWVNNFVDLAPKIAEECFVNWYMNDSLQTQRKIGSLELNPESITTPVLAIIPKKDHIVPEKSALALAQLFPNKLIINPTLGHVGMITGTRAPKDVWSPMMAWIDEIINNKNLKEMGCQTK